MSYQKCLECFVVFLAPCGDEPLGESQCPICGSVKAKSNWPGRSVEVFYTEFYRTVATYEPALDEAYGFHTLQVAGIYFAVVFEILLELMVRDLLQKLTIPQNIQEIVFRAHQGRDRLTSLFKSLTGVSLKQAMDEVKSGYYDHALQICRRRNEYLHGNDRAFDQTPIDDLQVLADHTLDVFAGVNNKYVCRQAINSPD